MNFWQDLPKKPIVGLAPMDGVTDYAYRQVQATVAKPDVIVTEFIPVEGIIRMSEKLLQDFWYRGEQRPVVAQIYGNDPLLFYYSAQLACELGFDGVDINMGCPAKTVVHRGCGAGLIRTPEVAAEIIKAVQQAVIDWQANGIAWETWPLISSAKAKRLFNKFLKDSVAKGMYDDRKQKIKPRQLVPVSVKTRIGYEAPEVETWLPIIASLKPAAITLHGRTLKQFYTGLADWQQIRNAAKIVKEISPNTKFLGNGDIKSLQDAKEKIADSEIDGVLVGRGTYGNPWLLAELMFNKELEQTMAVKTETVMQHAQWHEDSKSPGAFVQMRKILAWYINGIPNASSMRSALMLTKNTAEVREIFRNYLTN